MTVTIQTLQMSIEIAFNPNCVFSEHEKEFITKSLTNSSELKEKLENYNKSIIYVLKPIHYSSHNDDALPHFTFRISNKSTEMCDIPFIIFDDFHGYVWKEEDGFLTLEFITQYKNDEDELHVL